jgi:thymidylate synthase
MSVNYNEQQYLNLVKDVLENGIQREDRTGTGTLSVFGRQLRFKNIEEEFPLITTKEVNVNSIIIELLWFISGKCDYVQHLQENGVRIWDNWVLDEHGFLGPIYGVQWREYEGTDRYGNDFQIDQLNEVINQIKVNPTSRRLIVNSWNVGEINSMALPPCHTMFQFYVESGKLSMMLYQRSCDIMIGGPYNIAQYSILLIMIARVTGLNVGEFIWTIGDAHIYSNHIENAKTQLIRSPYIPPSILVNKKNDIDDYKIDDVFIINYFHHPKLKFEISV